MTSDQLPSSWTQTSAGTDEHKARWSQLKRTFAVPASLAAKQQAAIRARAQEIYWVRVWQGTPGTPLGDWLRAEKEVVAPL